MRATTVQVRTRNQVLGDPNARRMDPSLECAMHSALTLAGKPGLLPT